VRRSVWLSSSVEVSPSLQACAYRRDLLSFPTRRSSDLVRPTPGRPRRRSAPRSARPGPPPPDRLEPVTVFHWFPISSSETRNADADVANLTSSPSGGFGALSGLSSRVKTRKSATFRIELRTQRNSLKEIAREKRLCVAEEGRNLLTCAGVRPLKTKRKPR